MQRPFVIRCSKLAGIILAAISGTAAGKLLDVYRASRTSGICAFPDAVAGLISANAIESRLSELSNRCTLTRSDSSGLQLWSTPIGEYWFPSSIEPRYVHYIAAQWHNSDAYDGAPIKKGDVVLDCGGFVGDYAKHALRCEASRVITIEPSAEALECIRRNLAEEIANGRVIVYPKGVWDREERLLLRHHAGGNPAANSLIAGGDAGEWVTLTTIDQIVEELGLSRLDVLKMDIEGAEQRALAGARQSLTRFRPLLAIATEHTSDVLENNRAVISRVHSIAPIYQPQCGVASITEKGVLPETLFFVPR